MINEKMLDGLKSKYLFEILEARSERGSSALFAYARYLNRERLSYFYFPLYLKVLEANNMYAVDALVEGYEPERFFDFIAVPNQFVLREIFLMLDSHRAESLYVKSVRVICAFLMRTYHIVEEGYRIYAPTIADVNNIGKNLNESKGQDHKGNRSILDILQALSELDRISETDQVKSHVGRQASRIRAEFLDHQRVLLQAITQPILEKAEETNFGIIPDQLR